jgi:hypothetical protein
VNRFEHRGRNSRPDAAAAARPGARALRLLALLVLVALVVYGVPAARATTYKWVDEKGVVHYTDKIPPEAMNKGNVELDKRGVQIKTNPPPPTPEQLKAKAEEATRQTQMAKDRELIDRRDRALLATYTVESEIDLARKRALSTIDAQVQSSTVYSATLTKRKAELEAKKAELGDKPLPIVIERELANISAELAKQTDLLTAKQREIVAVNARYDADKKRWKELRAATEAQMTGAARATPTAAK